MNLDPKPGPGGQNQCSYYQANKSYSFREVCINFDIIWPPTCHERPSFNDM